MWDFVAQLGRMLFVVSSDADNFGWLDGMNQCSFFEVDMLHPAAGETFDVAIAMVGSLGKKTGDFLTSGDGLNEAVMDRTVKGKSRIAHASVI